MSIKHCTKTYITRCAYNGKLPKVLGRYGYFQVRDYGEESVWRSIRYEDEGFRICQSADTK